MRRKAARRLTVAALAVGVAAVATAQPIPYTQLGQSPVMTPAAPFAGVATTESGWLREALNAAKTGDVAGARAASANLADPLARRLALWALVDTSAESLGFAEVDRARRELLGWPRAARRQAAAEKLLTTSGYSPSDVIAWFGAAPPQTADGALALALAQRNAGQAQAAAATIRAWWRDKVFEADAQARILANFAGARGRRGSARRRSWRGSAPTTRAGPTFCCTASRAPPPATCCAC